MITRFDSIAALRAESIRLGNGKIKNNRHNDTETTWFGGETESDTRQKSLVGDVSLVPEAEKLIANLEYQIETPRRIWERSPVGHFCVVPDVLAGLPTPMRRQIEVGDEHQPINIGVVVTSSGGIDAETLQKRGTTILALVLALSRSRPISLEIINILGSDRRNDDSVIVARIETAPLDLSLASYCLTSSGLSRRLLYGLGYEIHNANGHWPNGFIFSNPQPYIDTLTLRLNYDPKKSLIIPPARLNEPMLNDPVKWLNTQITFFLERTTEQ